MILNRGKKNEARNPQLMDGQDDISFRRSRTLQGTTSSNVKAANQKRAELKSDRLKKQQKQRRRRLLMSGILILAVMLLIAWYLVSQYTIGVGRITFSSGTKTSPSENEYKDAINEYWAVRPAERFRFALSEERLSQFMAEKLPETAGIELAGASANHADFNLSLRKPIASWKTGSGQSFVDKDGVSFSNNYFATPTVVITDNSGAESKSNGAVVSERFLRFLGRLVALTNESGLGEVTEASLPKNTTRQIDIKIKGRPYAIKTHIDRDPAATVEDIKRVVGYLEQKKITPSYIDVRIAGRAFYK